MVGKNSIVKNVSVKIGKDIIAVTVQLDKLYRICDINCPKKQREIILSAFRGRQGNSPIVMEELSEALNSIVDL